jgi:hypothetical protein
LASVAELAVPGIRFQALQDWYLALLVSQSAAHFWPPVSLFSPSADNRGKFVL